jgi:hypothetical protein
MIAKSIPLPDSAPAPESTGGGADRREADRHRTVWRIAKVLREGDAGLWRIRNISDRGMMLAADVPIAVGERLEVALSDLILVRGRVVWTKEGRCGVAFDEPVDVTEVLRQLAAEQQAAGYRQPRLPVRIEAQVTREGRSAEVEVADLSHSGAGVVHDGAIEAGREVDLLLPGGIRRTAIVRWSRGERGGLWLTQPLRRADLESIRRLEE